MVYLLLDTPILTTYASIQGDAMADSFFLVPSKSEAPLATLKKENAALKAKLEAQQTKLAAAERLIQQRKEQDQHLRDSIMLARKEVFHLFLSKSYIYSHLSRHNERCPLR
jgi:regulator of replication initiation timing